MYFYCKDRKTHTHADIHKTETRRQKETERECKTDKMTHIQITLPMFLTARNDPG